MSSTDVVTQRLTQRVSFLNSKDLGVFYPHPNHPWSNNRTQRSGQTGRWENGRYVFLRQSWCRVNLVQERIKWRQWNLITAGATAHRLAMVEMFRARVSWNLCHPAPKNETWLIVVAAMGGVWEHKHWTKGEKQNTMLCIDALRLGKIKRRNKFKFAESIGQLPPHRVLEDHCWSNEQDYDTARKFVWKKKLKRTCAMIGCM